MNKKDGGVFIPNGEIFESLRLKKNLDKSSKEVIKEMLYMFPNCNEIRDYKNKVVWKRDDNSVEKSN